MPSDFPKIRKAKQTRLPNSLLPIMFSHFRMKIFRITLCDYRFLCTFAPTIKAKSGCSAVGSALRSGRRGRAFESPHPDKSKQKGLIVNPFFVENKFFALPRSPFRHQNKRRAEAHHKGLPLYALQDGLEPTTP